MRRYPAVVSTSIGGPTDATIELQVRPSEIRVGMRGAPPTTLEYKRISTPDTPAEALDRVHMLARDTIFAIAMQLRRIGYLREAAQLLRSIIDEASVVHDDGLLAAVTVLARGGERRAAARLLDMARTIGVQHAELVATLVDGPPGEDDVFAEVLDDWVQRDVAAGDLASAAPVAYNIGHRAISNRPDVAVDLLVQAAELDPSYRERDYWNREVGGAAFLAGDFLTSAQHYKRAVELGDKDSMVRLGDALLFTGQYEKALNLFRAAGDTVREAEYRLKAWLIEPLISEYKITAQDRDIFTAERLCDNDQLDNETAKQALRHDLLCPQALWALGSHLLTVGRELFGVQHLLAAVLTRGGNGATWMRLLGTSQPLEGHDDIMRDVLLCARQFAGADILDEVWEVAPQIGPLMESMFEGLPPFEEPPVIVRATSFGSADYTVFER